MRRSTQVFAPLLASAAVALLAGCRSSDMQRCVDENNQVVDPSFCKSLPQGTQSVVGTVGNRGGYYGPTGLFIPHVYRYYYGGGGGSTVAGRQLCSRIGPQLLGFERYRTRRFWFQLLLAWWRRRW